MRIIFAGTPEFAATHLLALLQAEADIVGVYTQPDRPAGRGRKLTASPVKALALAHDLPVFQPASLKTPEAQQQLAELRPDVMIVVAYGLILPPTVLQTPTHGCLNVHASLLPRWRGAAPIQRAIEAGDAVSGVTIMQMDEGLDTGDMLVKHTVEINAQTTSASLHDELAKAGGVTLLQVMADLLAYQASATIQPDTAVTYAEKLSKAEAWIDWHESAEAIDRKIRAFNPWPVAQTTFNGKRLRIFAASMQPSSALPAGELQSNGLVGTGDHALQLLEVQLEGGKRLSIDDFLRSREVAGVTLGEPAA